MDDRWQLDSVDDFTGELHGMRDSVESEGAFARASASEKERGKGGGRERVRGSLVEEGDEDEERAEW